MHGISRPSVTSMARWSTVDCCSTPVRTCSGSRRGSSPRPGGGSSEPEPLPSGRDDRRPAGGKPLAGRSNDCTRGSASDVEVLHVPRVLLDEVAAGLHLFAHELGEDLVGHYRVL